MSATPAGQPSERSATDPDGDPPAPAPGPVERYGPLAIHRHEKADGRALILYSRVQPA